MKTDLKELIGKLNGTCRTCLETAAALCVSQTNYNVEMEHFLVRLLETPDSDLNRILKYYDLDASEINRELMAAIDQFDRGNNRTPAFSLHLMQMFEEGWIMSSLVFGEPQIRSGAILLGLLSHEALRGVLVESSKTLLEIPRHKLRQDVKELCKGTVEDSGPKAATPRGDAGTKGNGSNPTTQSKAASDPKSKNPALDQFTINLTERAREGQIDPIQGRDFEIRQVIDILTRRRQNNPILTGEAGVGKTAVAEGFALRIAVGDVPPSLKQVALHSLDLGLLQAGAGVKGEFENRLKSVINEVKASPTPIILFIDEAHTLIGAGAGGQQGQSDAANLLKPALARGELRTIAATTWSEYKKYFEKDPALTRRFQVVKVDEPSPDVAIDMVRGIVEHLEKHHEVVILDEAVSDAVILSDRYITGRQLPDKAISVLDTACARVGLGQNATPPKVEDAQRRIELLRLEIEILKREETAGRSHKDRLENLQEQLKSTQSNLEQLEKRWYQEQDMVKEIHELREEENDSAQKIIALENKLEAFQGEEPMVPVFVDSRVVASVISGWTGIPVGKMLTNEIQNVLDLKNNLQERVIGQDSGLEAICRRIRTSRADLDDPEKPVGVFLLAGPSGVGKTETALALADLLFGGERNLVKINMSEYQESYTVSNLKGSPPGYVGFGQGGVLTEAVRRAPYSVVLLDEIEKAHNDVVELFYQVFDKGEMEDSEGVQVDFKNTVILLTSNAGSDVIMSLCQNGGPSPSAGDLEKALRPELLKTFKPAFLGRTVIVPYFPLGDGEIRDITRLKLAKIQGRFEDNHRAKLNFDDSVIEAVVERCTEVESGARNVDHILTHTLLPDLGKTMLEKMAEGTSVETVQVTLNPDGNFAYEIRNT
ncbi:MAG: type VI secretion system ATPase TssH [Candidatus Nitronauta litoralis]|uniref:Type VI secretion system ATPase TssH n=1 Tax=Candidatus Nitronauta litoralis TaxID=2705533 RepID=A0A7T0BT85_9BACT|nr:MAG: type VI secretion system ATPase TssH [Candidatus Nitronauta litoralis]